jgi:acyl-CoA synthetase (AMP-forming)/AMP-acid ligase II
MAEGEGWPGEPASSILGDLWSSGSGLTSLVPHPVSGLSEGSCASTLNPYDGVRKPGTVGLPLPGQEVQVVDQLGRPLPQGERGEVVIRGANVMRGYLNRPEDTAKTIVDGWLHTGDVGIFDEDATCGSSTASKT